MMLGLRSPLSPFNANRPPTTSPERRRDDLSPTKITLVQDENDAFASPSGPPSSPFIVDTVASPRKTYSPAKARTPATRDSPMKNRRLTQDALQEHSGRLQAIDRVDESKIDPLIRSPRDEARAATPDAASNGYPGMDDTCFSAFSAVPAEMTRYANLDASPSKPDPRTQAEHFGGEGATPRQRVSAPTYHDNSEIDHATLTPRRIDPRRDGDTTNLLMEFTQEIADPRKSPARSGRLSPSKSEPLRNYALSRRTPSPAKHGEQPASLKEARHLANLLDFDLPPAPTPRSVPSITARELESMKSDFLSQISSLTAKLSGSEAEVKALSTAVKNAEHRVGEALEQVRNEKQTRESLQSEKQELEGRQKEMQKVLKDVKEEIICGDREKDVLLQRAQEAEYRREEAESKAIGAQAQLDNMKSSQPASSVTPCGKSNVSSEVEAAVMKVSQELHGLYKTKHEQKVTALKKSYSDRWGEKVRELQTQLDRLTKDNEDLKVGRNATMTGILPGTLGSSANAEELVAERAEHEGQLLESRKKLEVVEEELISLQQELTSSKTENDALHIQIAASRTEIDDLISATEELMQLSQSTSGGSNADIYTSKSEDIKNSLSRSQTGLSGLKAPGFGSGATYSGESKIGKVANGYAGGVSRERCGSGLGMRSGIMSNIERMGRGRAAE